MDKTRKLALEITQEIGDDEYLDTCETLSPEALIGAVVVDVHTNSAYDSKFDVISGLHLRIADGRVITVTFAIDEGMLLEQWIPLGEEKGDAKQ